jgi:cysteine desulfurase
MTRVYMDANATTPLLPEVVEAMRPYWTEHFGNASSIHLDGQQAHSAVDRARATLAEFLNCHDAEVVFNSGGTEGDNTALFGLLRPGDHFVTTAIEHSAILAAAERLEKFGVAVTTVAPAPSGLIDLGAIERALRPETRLISVMLANNETGVLQPVEEIGKIAKAAGTFFHIDAVQGAGKVSIDVRSFGCHLLSISAHKMHGPKGVGALFVRRGTPLESLMWAEATSAAAAPEPRTSPASSAWPKPPSWPCTRWKMEPSRVWRLCATAWRPGFCSLAERA